MNASRQRLSKVAVVPVSLALVLLGCDDDATSLQSQTTAAPTVEVTPSTAAATATAEPTPTPTPAPEIVAPEIVSFSMAGGQLSVRLHNPNENHGLIRAGFELAILDESGGIIAVEGSSGFQGAPCCTIYQLPPGGDYGLWSILLPPDTPTIGSLELTIPGDPWVEWSRVDSAIVTVTDASLRSQFGVTVTGRAGVDKPGPFNAWIVAFADTPQGEMVIADVVDCLTDDAPRAFEVNAFNIDPIDATLTEVIAYPTTVSGHGDGFTPDC